MGPIAAGAVVAVVARVGMVAVVAPGAAVVIGDPGTATPALAPADSPRDDDRSCASAASEYGSLTAFGPDLYASEFGRSTRAAATGFASVTGGTVTSGALLGPAPTGADPSGEGVRTRITCPTRMTFRFSMLFIAASSR